MNLESIRTEDLLSFVATIVAFAAMLGLLYWVKNQIRKKNTTLGKWLNEHFLREQASWILIILISFSFSEGILAATIPVGDEEYVNHLSRMFAHLCISMVGVIIAIGSAMVLINFFESIANLVSAIKKDKKKVPIYFYINVLLTTLLVAATIYLTLWLPYLNVSIIANGLDEMHLLYIAWVDFTTFGDMSEFYLESGLPEDYDYRTDMSYSMYASWILYRVHIALALFDSIHAAHDRINKHYLKVGNLNQKISSAGNVDKDQIKTDLENDPIPILEELLDTTNRFNSQTALENAAVDCENSLFNLSTANQGKISGKLAQLYARLKAIEGQETSGTITQAEFDTKINALGNEVVRLVEDTTNNGKGLGVTLSKKNTRRGRRKRNS